MFTAELEAARLLARQAGRAAMRRYGSADAGAKVPEFPATAACRASTVVIVQGLRELFPNDAVLAEESRYSEDRMAARRIWIVNPLDETTEFLAQNGEFSIMIGLAVDGEAVLGVVYRPDGDVLYFAARWMGAWRERDGVVTELRRVQDAPDTLRMVDSRSCDNPIIERIRIALGATIRASGSVGMKCARIAEDECDLYANPGPHLKEWDTCAPEVILREAGGTVTDCKGRRLRYNKLDPCQPHGFVACAPGVADRALDAIRIAMDASEIAAVGGA